jgi:hypothetical protein
MQNAVRFVGAKKDELMKGQRYGNSNIDRLSLSRRQNISGYREATDQAQGS